MKRTSVRLLAEHKDVVEQGLNARSAYVNEALREFFSWESHLELTKTKRAQVDGTPWLDAVQIGVDYKTKLDLLDPVVVILDTDTETALSEAVTLVERIIPRLKRKGVRAGIIRGAVQQRLHWDAAVLALRGDD